MSKVNSLKITYSIEGSEQGTLSIDPNMKVSALVSHILSLNQSSSQEYNVFYNKKLISGNSVIKECVGNEITPHFLLKPSRVAASHTKTLEENLDLNPEPIIITKISIEWFPSRSELYTLLDDFLLENGHKKDYTFENKDAAIIFSFKDSVKIEITNRTLPTVS